MITSTDDDIILCSNCGKGEESAGDLKACTACKMVKYCNRECQIAHRRQHKKACKKRAAELHNKALFKPPPPPEDCPICMLPLPSLSTGAKYYSCCGKDICSGCVLAVALRDIDEQKCPFCRTSTPDSEEEALEINKKRVEAGDACGIFNLGVCYRDGDCGLPQDNTKALELYHRAGELGNAKAYFIIGSIYHNGRGVERNVAKANHYFELAAIGGNVLARHVLGCFEASARNWDRAIKHWLIGAGSGYNDSVKGIQQLYLYGHATKEDYTKALLAYQKYLDEIRSEQRDKTLLLPVTSTNIIRYSSSSKVK